MNSTVIKLLRYHVVYGYAYFLYAPILLALTYSVLTYYGVGARLSMLLFMGGLLVCWQCKETLQEE